MKKIELCNGNEIKNRLVKYGFKEIGGKGIYSFSMPLYKYHDNVVIEARFMAFPYDSYIGYDVINTSNDMLYFAFYDRNMSNSNENEVLKKVCAMLNKELESMRDKKIIKRYEKV